MLTPAHEEAPAVAMDSIPYTSLFSSTTSGFSQPVEQTVRDGAAYRQVMDLAYGVFAGAELPPVDLAQRVVVVVAIGERSTGGHGIRIDGIEHMGDGAMVRYTVTEPGPNCMAMQVITSPVEVLSIPRVPGEIRFERRTVVEGC